MAVTLHYMASQTCTEAVNCCCVIDENTQDLIELRLKHLMSALHSASSHTYLIQSATVQSSATEQGCLEIDDNRQQEIRCSTQTAAKLSMIAAELK
jgi:hypothetical protein